MLKYLYTMRYTKLLSYFFTKRLQRKLGNYTFKIRNITFDNKSPKTRNVYYHGFKLLLGGLNKGLLLLLVGLALGIFPQLIVATASFALLRVFVGGLHFDSYTKCAYVSLISFITIGLLSKYTPYNYTINLLVFTTLLYICIMYAPIEHKNRLLNKNEKRRFKYISLIILVILFAIQITINDNNIKNSIMFGVLLSGIISAPITKLSNMVDRFKLLYLFKGIQ